VLLRVSSGILATYFNTSIYKKDGLVGTNQVDMAKTSTIAIMKSSEASCMDDGVG